jgi:hypothetical protein
VDGGRQPSCPCTRRAAPRLRFGIELTGGHAARRTGSGPKVRCSRGQMASSAGAAIMPPPNPLPSWTRRSDRSSRDPRPGSWPPDLANNTGPTHGAGWPEPAVATEGRSTTRSSMPS